MKTINYILFILVAAWLSSCTDDDKSVTTYDENFLPKIYTDGWSANVTVTQGDELNYSNLEVSPNDENTTFSWYINDKVISTERVLNYIVTEEEGSYTLKFEVKRFKKSTFRKATLKVKATVTPEPPFIPNAFTPKAFLTKAIGFYDINEDSNPSEIIWDNITHIVLTSAIVEEYGIVTYPCSEKKMREIVNAAHDNGVYVMLQVAGLHENIQGKNKYGATTFRDLAGNGERNDAFIEELYNYADNNALDGINIYMDKATSSTEGYKDKAELVTFFQKLIAAKPTQSRTELEFYLTMNLITYGALTSKGHLDDFVTIKGWDWFYTMDFGIIETINPNSHAPQVTLQDDLTYWQSKGINKEKLMITVSAIASLYDANSYETPTINNCISFIKYSELFSMFPGVDIAQKNNLDTEAKALGYTGCRYDGLPWINTKIGYISKYGAGGVALWKMNFDTTNPETSMMSFIRKTLKNP